MRAGYFETIFISAGVSILISIGLYYFMWMDINGELKQAIPKMQTGKDGCDLTYAKCYIDTKTASSASSK